MVACIGVWNSSAIGARKKMKITMWTPMARKKKIIFKSATKSVQSVWLEIDSIVHTGTVIAPAYTYSVTYLPSVAGGSSSQTFKDSLT